MIWRIPWKRHEFNTHGAQYYQRIKLLMDKTLGKDLFDPATPGAQFNI